MADSSENQFQIDEAERSIEDALWDSIQDKDHERALERYERARKDLESLIGLTGDEEREQKRVLSYCLMRINDTLENLERSEGNIPRAEESLRLAEESENRVQILRSKLALGIALLNSGQIRAAESHFTDIILQTQDETEDTDAIQVMDPDCASEHSPWKESVQSSKGTCQSSFRGP